MPKFLMAVLLASLLPACASPQKVPSTRADDLPALSFKALSPRNLAIVVKNTRAINQKAGNSAQVEQAILDAVLGATTRGGLALKANSRNKLAIAIEDYDQSGPLGQQPGECVKITGVLQAKWGATLMSEGYACHQLKHLLFGITLGGDISEAYTMALKLMLNQLESKQMELLRGGSAL